MTDEVLDSTLVERVQRGDKRAFDLLVKKYQSRVLALVARYIRDRSEAQDVAQEAFIRAYRALPSFRGESQFYTWLYRIAVNAAHNQLAAQKRRPQSIDMDAEDADFIESASALRDTDTPEGLLAESQLRGAVNRAIAGLPEDLRVAITLREYDGLSYEEIAEIMRCPIGTVRSRIFRAREAIDNGIAAYV